MNTFDDDQFKDGNMVVSSSVITKFNEDIDHILSEMDIIKARHKAELEPYKEDIRTVFDRTHDCGVPRATIKRLLAKIKFDHRDNTENNLLEDEEKDVLYFAREIIAKSAKIEASSLPSPKTYDGEVITDTAEKSNADALDDILGG